MRARTYPNTRAHTNAGADSGAHTRASDLTADAHTAADSDLRHSWQKRQTPNDGATRKHHLQWTHLCPFPRYAELLSHHIDVTAVFRQRGQRITEGAGSA
jgi:hypothetical protein